VDPIQAGCKFEGSSRFTPVQAASTIFWQQMNQQSGIIEAQAPTEAIRKSYDLGSNIYGLFSALFERKPRMIALKRASIQPHDTVLEVAVGPGLGLVEILKQVSKTNIVYGIDLSPKMLEKAQQRVQKTRFTNVDLREADARQLPFPDETFDIVFNCYMLDLIPLGDLSVVLEQFKRVLKPGGRLVLVNMSKPDACQRTWWESVYQRLPRRWVPYLLGGCRPVVMAGLVNDVGFEEVRREFVPDLFLPSEIVSATKPRL
jgi:ubiquinone/menaquinone biosynthesis C-methylase UbiE